MYKPKYLQPWVEYVNYIGDCFDGYYIAAWRFFRCSSRERSDFKYVKDHLKDCRDTKGVECVTFSDAIMMARYYVLVHRDNEAALRMADMFAERVKRKGSLDPDTEAAMNEKAIHIRWRRSSLDARVQYCRESGVSVFAARRKELPPGDKIKEIMGDV